MSICKVSMVVNAHSVETETTPAAAVIRCIKEGKWEAQILKIHAEWGRATREGHSPRESVKHLKEMLPGILWTGTFSQRGREHIVEHSGLLCLDLDAIDPFNIGAVSSRLERDPHVWACFASPTGSGLKVVVRIPADPALHAASFATASRHVLQLTGCAPDRSGADLARLCFVSFDPETYFNPEAQELAVTSLPSKARMVSTGGDLVGRRAVAEHILGPVDWQDERAGFVTCPGRHLHTTGDNPKDCRVTVDGAPTLFCLHQHCQQAIEDKNRELRSAIGKGEVLSEDPEEIAIEPRPYPEPPGVEAFHGLAGELVDLIRPHTEADPVAILVSFLAAFGNMVGPGPHFMVEGRRHPARIWPVLVGNTSKARKGSAWSSLRLILDRVDEAWTRDCVASGLVSGEGLVYHVRDAVTKTGKDGKLEVLDEGVTEKRLLCVEEEFSAILKACAREKNTLSDLMRRAWDTGELRTMAKNTPCRATGAHVTVLGHITKGELTRLLAEADVLNGFGNRLVWVCVRRSQLLPEGGALHQVNLNPVVENVRRILDFAKGVDLVTKTDDAKEYWRGIYTELAVERPGLVGALSARAEAQVMRLALIYALLDRARQIDVPHLQAARALMVFSFNSCGYVFGDSFGDPVADRIYEALRQSPQGLTSTEVSALFDRNLPRRTLHASLCMLATTVPLMRIRQPAKGPGRPQTIWKLTNETKKTLTETSPNKDELPDGAWAQTLVPSGQALQTPETAGEAVL